MSTDTRALATIERILRLDPIEGADSIEAATVRSGEIVPELGRSTFKVVSNKYLTKEK